MRKSLIILLGLILLGGALAGGYYRLVYEPARQQQRSAEQRSTRSAQPSRSPSDQRSDQRPRGGQTTNQDAVQWPAFDTVINILNVVVGIVGIWLSIAGMRMQRQAMAVIQRRDG